MRHIIYQQRTKYPVAILIKPQQLKQKEIQDHYITPSGINPAEVVVFDLAYEAKKAPVKLQKEYLATLLPELCNLRSEVVLCCDGAYFKTLTKQTKAEPHYGYALPCTISGYEHLKIVLCPNYAGLFFDPAIQSKIDLALTALATTYKGTYEVLGQDIIHSAYYPSTVEEIEAWLESLHQYPLLSADIEAFSLKFYKAGIGSIGFA